MTNTDNTTTTSIQTPHQFGTSKETFKTK